jgi:hypothetical protein
MVTAMILVRNTAMRAGAVRKFAWSRYDGEKVQVWSTKNKRWVWKGTALGRPRTAPAVEKRIRGLRAKGMGVLKIGRTLGVGTYSAWSRRYNAVRRRERCGQISARIGVVAPTQRHGMRMHLN